MVLHSSITRALCLILVWLVFTGLTGHFAANPYITGDLAGADDYMRLTGITTWLEGGGLPYIIPGLGVEGQTALPWSRLADWPVLILSAPFWLVMDQKQALLAGVSLTAPVAFLVIMGLTLWMVRPLVPINGGRWLALPALGICIAIIQQVLPGRIDHHMWQIIFTLAGFGAAIRMALGPDPKRHALLAGFAFGTGLAIGVDIIPMFALANILLGWHWLITRHGATANAMAGLAALASVAILMLLLRPDGAWMTPSCDALSLFHIGLATAVGLFWCAIAAAQALIPQSCLLTFRQRAAVAFLPAVLITAGLYALAPGCFTDPYQFNTGAVKDIWLAYVHEAQPLPLLAAEKPGIAVLLILPPLLGLAGALAAQRCDHPPRRTVWQGLALVLACGIALTFWQVRVTAFVQCVAIVPLTWGLFTTGRHIHEWFAHMPRPRRLGVSVALFMAALGLYLYVINARPQGQAQPLTQSCDIRAASDTLNTFAPGQTIAAGIDFGPELLYRTDHNVLAAPYHTNEAGIMAAYKILGAQTRRQALQAVKRYNTDLILICGAEDFYWRDTTGGGSLASRLIRGDVPGWLAPVESPGAIRIYRVDRQAISAGQKPG